MSRSSASLLPVPFAERELLSSLRGWQQRVERVTPAAAATAPLPVVRRVRMHSAAAMRAFVALLLEAVPMRVDQAQWMRREVLPRVKRLQRLLRRPLHRLSRLRRQCYLRPFVSRATDGVTDTLVLILALMSID